MTKKDKKELNTQAYDMNADFYSEAFDRYGIRVDDIDKAFSLNLSESSAVLELGCGNGRDAQYIVSRVGKDNYTGVDPSEGLIKIARVKNPRVTFHVKYMSDFLDQNIMNSGEFGLIFAFHSMLHVNHEELIETVRKCLKSLKTGGILYLSSKYGEYKEIEIENLGSKKYYYSYKPEDIEDSIKVPCETVYKVIYDSGYGPSFTLALRKK